MGRKKQSKKFSITRYLPVFIILLSITIIVGSTFAYFTDRKEETSELTFSKVELSSETTIGVNGELRDVIPGTKLVDGEVAFSKSIDSEAIYVRAKIAFSLPSEYEDDADMNVLLDALRSATDFNIVSTSQHGAVWSAKQGNYFYLLDNANTSNLMRVDTIDKFVLSSEVVVPRDLKQLDGNAQYMKSINFHVAFEAIQADNVSNVLNDTKEVFDVLFPSGVKEVDNTIKLTFKGLDFSTNLEVLKFNDGDVTVEYKLENIVENGTTTKIFDGWYTDTNFENKFVFGSELSESVILYPKMLDVSSGLAYALNADNETYNVGDGKCKDAEVVLPELYNGKKVTTIAKSGFQSNTNLTNIYMPEIMYIESSAFYGCTNLNITELPKNIKRVAYGAFTNVAVLENDTIKYLPISESDEYAVLSKQNTSITTVNWPGKVRIIAGSSFSGCYSLEISELPLGLQYIGEGAFYNCTKVTFTSLPETVNYIDAQAFYCCYKLALTSLPEGLTEIPKSTFVNCTSLALETLPDSIVKIGEGAFNGCKVLALTKLPESLEIMELGAFINCKALNITTLPSGLTSLPQNAFFGCTNLTLSVIPNNITSIGMMAFENCVNITSISLPEGLLSIGGGAFRGCTSLQRIDIPASCTSLGNSFLSGCTSLTNINIDSNNNKFNDGNGGNCIIENETNKLIAVCNGSVLPDSIVTIGNSVFSGRTDFNVTSLPSSLETIEQSAFYGCTSLALTSLPSNLKVIGPQAFEGCTSLALSSIPSSVTSIGMMAFKNCTSLTITSLPSTIQEIGGEAFLHCSNVRLTSIPSNLIETSSTAFTGCNLPSNDTCSYLLIEGTTNDYFIVKAINTDITSVEWPGVVKSIAGEAFSNCRNLLLSELPNGLEYIGYRAFSSCSSITITSLPNTIQKIEYDVFSGCNLPQNDTLIYLPIDGTDEYAIIDTVNTSVSIVESIGKVRIIAGQAFYDCSSLKLVEISEGLQYMGVSAFSWCSRLDYILCENSDIAVLAQGKGRGDTCIYLLSEGGDTLTYTDKTVGSMTIGVKTDTDGYKWVRTGDSTNGYKYYKAIA